jgi:hypothetical protein
MSTHVVRIDQIQPSSSSPGALSGHQHHYNAVAGIPSVVISKLIWLMNTKKYLQKFYIKYFPQETFLTINFSSPDMTSH